MWRNYIVNRLVSSILFSSVIQLCPTLPPHGLQHTSLPCPFSNFRSLLKLRSIELVMPSNHLTLCCLLFLLPSIFPSIRVFSSVLVLHMRWPKYWISASASVLPMNIQDWCPLGWTDWISFQSKGLSRVFSNTTVQGINSLVLSFLYSPTLTSIHDYWKKQSLTRQTFAGKVMSLLFNMLSRLVIAFLPSSKCLLISWLQSPSVVILEPLPPRSLSLFPLFPHLVDMKWWDHDLSFMNVEF